MARIYNLFIANEDVAGAETFPSINPYSGEAWAHIPQASPSQVADAIAAARHAFNSDWRKTTGKIRGQLLLKLADLL
ncbi:MAG TPA: aldehyde dehydrogenase family protein, partial [Acidocella sp.]|nr:aldehyde dehydrogenase family protein [Acidocella sp.]